MVVLLIFGVLLTMAAVVTRAITAAQKRSVTTTRMAAVDAAIIQFVQQQRRLPCPGDGTKLASANDAGVEGGRDAVTGCTGNQQNGVVPWRALGLTEFEATDGWDRRLTLRVDADLGANNALDMSACDPAGSAPGVGAANACNTACTNTALATACTSPSNFLAGKGLTVKNVAGDILMNPAGAPHTGAAYVLVSHGETGGGGYMSSGSLGVSSTTDGTEEMKNYASQPFVSDVATYYVSDIISEGAGNTHFDDIVSHPSIMTVVSRAGLGPRSH